MQQLPQKNDELVGKFSKFLEDEQQKDLKKTVPEFLVCKITDELFVDPVMLSSGFTYEKKAIEKHFKINGYFDPMTR